MTDALVGRVLDGGPTCAGRQGVALHLVMTDVDLFGPTGEPAHLDGFGPISAELARELVAGALSEGEQVWLRRLYTHPDTNELVAIDSGSRRFAASLARFTRLRDRHCRTPWCEAPVRHVDHAVGHADGGPTSFGNGAGLCESCNYAEQGPAGTLDPVRTRTAMRSTRLCRPVIAVDPGLRPRWRERTPRP